jgi:hypothetical protein
VARRVVLTSETYLEFPLHLSHREAKRARNKYNELITKSKQDHWDSWLEGITAKSIWDLNKFSSAPALDGSKTRIPALNSVDGRGQPHTTLDNKGKSKLLHEVFF